MAGNEGNQDHTELDFNDWSYSPLDYQGLFGENEDQFVASLMEMEGASSSSTTGPIPPSMEVVAPSEEVGPNDDSELDFSLSHSPNFSPLDYQCLFGENEDQFVASLKEMEGASSSGTTGPIPPSMEVVAPSEEVGPNDDSELDFSWSHSPNFSPLDQGLYGEYQNQFVASLEAMEEVSLSGITGPTPPSAEIVEPNDEVGPNTIALQEPSSAVAEEAVFNNPISEIRHAMDVLNEPRIDYETYLQQQQQQQSTAAAVSSYVSDSESEAVPDAGQDQLPNRTDVEFETPMPHILTLDEFLNGLSNSTNLSANAGMGLPAWYVDPALAAALIKSGVSVRDFSLQQNIPSALETGPSTLTACIPEVTAGSSAATDEPEGVVPPSPPTTGQPAETVKKSRKRTAEEPEAEEPAPKKRTPKEAIQKTPEEEREEYVQNRLRNTEATRRSRDAKRERMNAMLEKIKELEKERVTLVSGLRFELEDNIRLKAMLRDRDLQNPK